MSIENISDGDNVIPLFGQHGQKIPSTLDGASTHQFLLDAYGVAVEHSDSRTVSPDVDTDDVVPPDSDERIRGVLGIATIIDEPEDPGLVVPIRDPHTQRLIERARALNRLQALALEEQEGEQDEVLPPAINIFRSRRRPE